MGLAEFVFEQPSPITSPADRFSIRWQFPGTKESVYFRGSVLVGQRRSSLQIGPKGVETCALWITYPASQRLNTRRKAAQPKPERRLCDLMRAPALSSKGVRK
jgi:hypothetical protein